MADLEAQIKITADASGVETGIGKAKKSLDSLGGSAEAATSRANKALDRYVEKLNLANATQGMSGREAKLYEFQLKGATEAQLASADAALRMSESYANQARNFEVLDQGLRRLAASAAAATLAAVVAFDQLIKKAGQFQDMSEKVGDTAQNLAALALAAAASNTSMETLVNASLKLTKGLTGVDDETGKAGAAVAALGLNLKAFKDLAPVDQLEAIAKALANFKDGPEKAAVAMALFGKAGAETLPFLKELNQEGGRQIILTDEQIAQADAYADAQARLHATWTLQAQALSTQVIPLMDSWTGLLKEVMKDEALAATAADLMRGAFGLLSVTLQTLLVVGSDVGFVLKGVGREIGGIAAQVAALAHGDLRGFTAISDAMKEDTRRARAELEKFKAQVMAVGTEQDPNRNSSAKAASDAAATAAANAKKPRLIFNGAATSGTAGKLAKEQLGLDIDAIKAAFAQVDKVYATAEKIFEARRSAGLINDRDYYTAKASFIRLDSQARNQEITDELTRVAQEKVTADNRAELLKRTQALQAEQANLAISTAAKLEILSIQETAAAKAAESALLSAKQAAQDYFATLNRQQARDLSSLGLGQRQRQLNTGIAQIEDRYTSQRQDLENNKARLELEGKFTDDARRQYNERLGIINDFQNKSIASYTDYFNQLTKMQADWSIGANSAIADYITESQDLFTQTNNLVKDNLQGMEDALVKFVMTGKLSFEDLANTIVADITRIIIKQQISNMIGVAGGAGGGGFFSDFLGSLLTPGKRANGGLVAAGGLYQVNERGPELLSIGSQQFLMMGNQAGQVTPNTGSPSVTNVIQVNVPAQAMGSRTTANQFGAEVGQQIRRALARNT